MHVRAMLAAVACLGVSVCVSTSRADGMEPTVVVDSLSETVGPEYAMAVDLLYNRHAADSLPWFKRCAPDMSNHWYYSFNYGVALQVASTESQEIQGRREPVMRSSFERMATLRQGLWELQQAELQAPTQQLRALAIAQQARLLLFVAAGCA
jgi:hypothetical protein